VPPKSRNSTLVAFDAEASKVAAVPDNVAPEEGMRTLVVGGGLSTVILMAELNALNALPAELKASDNKT
jgi:hypothetical protein